MVYMLVFLQNLLNIDMNKVFNLIHYFFTQKTPLIEHYNFFEPTLKRLDFSDYKLTSEKIILSTYFTSKKDPQRESYTTNDDFNYIKKFYESVIKMDFHAVIFYDTLSEDFLQKYSCENIKFLKVKLGPYSLNDERYYIYYEFIQTFNPTTIIVEDVNDVVFLKPDVFEYIKNNTLSICKDETFIYDNRWIQNKIKILPFSLDRKKYSFWNMPVVNAGVIGGEFTIIKNFLQNLIYLFEKTENDLNNNMVCVNIVFHDLYWLSYANSFQFKCSHIFNKNQTKNIANTKGIHIKSFNLGFPFTTAYKKEEMDSKAYIKHK